MLDIIAALAPLVIEYFKERRDASAAVKEEEFQDWLKTKVFPALLDSSAQALRTVVSMKAHNAEQFANLTRMVSDLHQSLLGTESDRLWSRSQPIDRALLQALYEDEIDGEGRGMSVAEMAEKCAVGSEAVERSGRFLAEHQLCRFRRGTGGASLAASPRGVMLVWEECDSSFLEQRRTLQRYVAEDQRPRLNRVSEQTGLKVRLLHYWCLQQHQLGHLKYHQYDGGQFGYNVIMSVAESFKRAAGS